MITYLILMLAFYQRAKVNIGHIGPSGVSTANTYYISPSGNDSADGKTPQTAWRTLAKVNQTPTVPGMRILLESGATFTGESLTFGPGRGGTLASPVIISTTGSGKAELSGGGISIYNVGGFKIENLKIHGTGNDVDCIHAEAHLSGSTLYGLTIDNVETYDCGSGINVYGEGDAVSGFSDIRITNSIAHDNAHNGIAVWGWGALGDGDAEGILLMYNVYVGHSTAYNNRGTPPDYGGQGGNGIFLGSVDTGTIERSVAYHNGGGVNDSAGPVGIWAWNAKHITIQYNESYGNLTQAGDGDGFDFDGGVSESVLQYNYSHDNYGPGYMLCWYYGGFPVDHNVIRYNISENDATGPRWAGILIYGSVTNADIYGNTIYNSTHSAVEIAAPSSSGIHFYNNIFYLTGAAQAIYVWYGGVPNLYQGNDYYSTGTLAFNYQNVVYYSLADWQAATGHEMVGGASVGFSVNPLLTAPGAGGTLNDAAMVGSQPTAYKLQLGSPMIHAGRDLTTLGIDPGPHNYFMNSIAAPFNIGAD